MTSSKIIAIAGGSCSGKTSLARRLADRLTPQRCSLLYQDNYYYGHQNIQNFDVPEAIEFSLLAQHLESLKQGQAVAVPTYDFTTHRRLATTKTYPPKAIIIVDGILILHAPELRHCFDLSVFVECDEDIRKQRRILRDSQERGREHDDIIKQFDEQVAPLHNRYVEPSKMHADIIYRNNGECSVDELICQRLLQYCLETTL